MSPAIFADWKIWVRWLIMRATSSGGDQYGMGWIPVILPEEYQSSIELWTEGVRVVLATADRELGTSNEDARRWWQIIGHGGERTRKDGAPYPIVLAKGPIKFTSSWPLCPGLPNYLWVICYQGDVGGGMVRPKMAIVSTQTVGEPFVDTFDFFYDQKQIVDLWAVGSGQSIASA